MHTQEKNLEKFGKLLQKCVTIAHAWRGLKNPGNGINFGTQNPGEAARRAGKAGANALAQASPRKTLPTGRPVVASSACFPSTVANCADVELVLQSALPIREHLPQCRFQGRNPNRVGASSWPRRHASVMDLIGRQDWCFEVIL